MRSVSWVLILVWLSTGCASRGAVREAPAPLPEFTPQARIEVLWTTDVGSLGAGSDNRLVPVLYEGVIYVSDARGRVHALSADSGQRLWQTELDRPVSGATAAGGDLVVVGTKKGQVIALERENGRQRWIASVSSEVQAPPTVRSQVVVVQTIDGKVFGLAAKEGRRLWTYARHEPALSLRGHATPTVVTDLVLAGFAGGKLVAVHLEEGRPLWEFTVAQPRGRNEVERLVDVDASPLIIGNDLYAVSYQGKIVAVDLRTGRVLWSRETSSYQDMDADRANIYLSDEKGNVLAFEQRTGASVWKQDKLRARGLSAPAVQDGLVAVGDFEGYVHWLARDDGGFVARYRLGSAPIKTKAIVMQDRWYIANQEGVLTALKLKK